MPFDDASPLVSDDVAALDEARALIENPERWTRGQFYKWDETNGDISFCVLGAVRNAWYSRGVKSIPSSVLWALIHALPGDAAQAHGCIGSYNDAPTTTHADILALIDRARERLLK